MTYLVHEASVNAGSREGQCMQAYLEILKEAVFVTQTLVYILM